MSMDKLGRGFADLPIEEQVQALRDHLVTQELLIKILLGAVEALGVTFTKGDVPLRDGDPVGDD